MKDEKITVSQKIEAICKSESLLSLPQWCMPPAAQSDEYYFISYSQKDYKKVYEDILLIQEEMKLQKLRGELGEGVSIWYDREMQAGKDWKQIADDVIFNHKCKGVIFYVSENSLMSDAIHREIEYSKTHAKPCFTINLPMESVEKYRGRELSAKQMLDALIEDGRKIDKEKYDYILKCFPRGVLYLGYSRKADAKVGQIKKLKKLPLFELSENGRIIAVKDTTVKEIKREEFEFMQTISPSTKLSRIPNCLFANCRRLENIELPASMTKIKSHAFMGCVSLKHINLSELTNLLKIGDFAFYHCVGLNEVDLPPSLTYIGKGAFYGCLGLKSVRLPASVTEVGEGAFKGCRSLEKVYVPSTLRLPPTAFENCPEAEIIYYNSSSV